ncbi:secretion protein HlyD family protein [Syntrophobotulus glycolicus DSM 8271]|uniref:Secretion protein HlyD family protein n=1 Tax=Syntrophobotulus glycolicus (strain DSM 8271 / FlGlyR) TaxID=645991 RepID=F0SZT9_SYNGF|nr:HlyD family efflux transporter periplasmic adaptor subunit [Syntrophobotulus glycolicus]ADY57260.1 secretion protein HlyD family protein [Syntrophobotulus glycolicus DSM 8271]
MSAIKRSYKVFIGLGVVGAAVAMVFLLSGVVHSSDGSRELTGKAEAKTVEVSTKIPGRVIQIKVKEGQTVKAGDVLAQIDDSDLKGNEQQVLAGIAAAEGSIAKAGAAVDYAEASSGAALEKARAGLAKAQADEVLAEKTYQRLEELWKSGAISQMDLDKAKHDYDAAQAGVAAAEGDLATAGAAQTQVDLYRADARSAQAALDKSQADLQIVRNNLKETVIKAPCDGVITAVNIEEKELVSSGFALMSVTDYQENWVNLKVPQNLLGQLAVGNPLEVYLPGEEGKTIKGTIEDISSKPEFATARATNDRGEKDIISYNVKIRTDSAELKPGMNVSVKF